MYNNGWQGLCSTYVNNLIIYLSCAYQLTMSTKVARDLNKLELSRAPNPRRVACIWH